MTISTRKRFRSLTAACALCVAGLLMQGVVYGAGIVPSNWNTSPATAGAYLESLESTPSPDWIGSLGSLDSVDSHVDVVTPSRQTTWFSGDHTKALKLNTGSSTMENALTGGGFSTEPVFVDMRVKFEALSSAPDLGTTYKCAVYASDATTLKVLHNGGTWTSGTITDLTAKWHQLTLKFNANDNTKFDVLLDDATVVSGLTLKNNTDKQLNAVAFSGTGYIDELYVSHGNPAYAGVPGNLPTTSDSVAAWISGKIKNGDLNATATFGNFNKSTLEQAYLLNALGSDKDSPANLGTPTFGIKSFELTSPTTLKVVVYLKVGDTGKTGTINGRIRVLSKATKGGTYTEQTTTTITSAEFASGTSTATYTFTVPEGHLFFKPTIVE